MLYNCPLTEEQKETLITLLSEEGAALSIEAKDATYSDELGKKFLEQSDLRNDYLISMIEAVWAGPAVKTMSEYDGCPLYKVVYTCKNREQLSPAIDALGDELNFVVHDFSEPGCLFGETINRKFDK